MGEGVLERQRDVLAGGELNARRADRGHAAVDVVAARIAAGEGARNQIQAAAGRIPKLLGALVVGGLRVSPLPTPLVAESVPAGFTVQPRPLSKSSTNGSDTPLHAPTVMLTVAGAEFTVPSLATKVKLSLPE